MNIPLLQKLMILSFALMFTLIAFNNIFDYPTNFELVKTVMSMETVKADGVKWRAITNPTILHASYISIIVWEALTALVCWRGCAFMITRQSHDMSVLGLAMGFILFMFGFVIVGGEWFYLWDSSLAHLHPKALLLSLMLLSAAFFASKK